MCERVNALRENEKALSRPGAGTRHRSTSISLQRRRNNRPPRLQHAHRIAGESLHTYPAFQR